VISRFKVAVPVQVAWAETVPPPAAAYDAEAADGSIVPCPGYVPVAAPSVVPGSFDSPDAPGFAVDASDVEGLVPAARDLAVPGVVPLVALRAVGEEVVAVTFAETFAETLVAVEAWSRPDVEILVEAEALAEVLCEATAGATVVEELDPTEAAGLDAFAEVEVAPGVDAGALPGAAEPADVEKTGVVTVRTTRAESGSRSRPGFEGAVPVTVVEDPRCTMARSCRALALVPGTRVRETGVPADVCPAVCSVDL